MIPGFEDNLIGMAEDEEQDLHGPLPRRLLRRPSSPGKDVEFTAHDPRASRATPAAADDALAQRRSARSTRSPNCEPTSVHRLERNALDRARHEFADRIIEYATANATVEIPDLLIDREVEVMVDELKVRLAEQRHRVRGVPARDRAR